MSKYISFILIKKRNANLFLEMLCLSSIPIANTKNKKQTKCKGRIVVVGGGIINFHIDEGVCLVPWGLACDV